MVKKISRFEMNKNAKSALRRHNVDTSQLMCSCSGSSIRLSGYLYKGSGGDFVAKQVEALWNDLNRLPGVRSVISDVENWNLTGGNISPKSEKKEKEEKNASSEPIVYHIDPDDIPETSFTVRPNKKKSGEEN